MNLFEEYESEQFGTLGTDTFRVFFRKILPNVVDKESAKIYMSPFHDIPLYSEAGTDIYRMIVRMPRWTNARMEICKTEPFNPIKHDARKDHLKYIENVFPFHGVIWNYGSFPQTWEMESYQNPDYDGFKGDNSQVDVIDIGSKIHEIGAVVDVKVLGALLLIDHDHLDWKIISIDIKDSLASKLDDLTDIDDYMPGLLNSTLEWFRYYKVPEGQGLITIGNKNKYIGKQIAYETIERSHKFWKNLIKNELYFKQSKDCVGFKLLNTQCIECNMENLKNDKEAENIIENFKQMIINRPIESIKNAPSKDQIEKTYFINKPDLIAKMITDKSKKLQEEQKNEPKEEKNEDKKFDISNFLKENFYTIMVPISVCVIISPLIYLRLKDFKS